ncbi:phytanoyl-CoA dioxygenase family protein [Mycobacterium sp. 1165178.9]|uniref:phytanoyl-CoA dioxygenase family protein n=1 Tax=Mycobacterium sp. 1165178.9 TaxID=1834070 RepID=UPI0007FBEEFE|nr:phytanoyl-CoA dioxygenase family protein [Mycobacterium sp. 1165178.9]OBK65204.1 phytanoyl-CoA dioxygenase [Mycobacterium sp. 1165178.9]
MSIDDEPVTTLEDLRSDLAQRYKRTPTGGSSVDSAVVEADLAALDRDGYVIWENLLSAEQCSQIRAAVRPWLGHTGRNSFEGLRTQRIYSVLSRTRVCDRLVDEPRVLAVLDRLLMPNYLLSALQAINIHPGEAAQLAHHDDGFYPIPRPRAPLAAATIWAIDDFTPDNGATVVYPGSHRWGKRRPGPDDQVLPVVMPAGSCVFFLGTLWHGGGANNTDQERLAVTAQYCQPWLRPMEAYTLSISRDIARAVSDDIRRMLGYSIHPPFVGYVDGLHPLRLLEADTQS